MNCENVLYIFAFGHISVMKCLFNRVLLACLCQQIHDGDTVFSPLLLGPLCEHNGYYDMYGSGYTYPLYSMTSSGNSVVVAFVSGETGTARGFNMTWTAGEWI